MAKKTEEQKAFEKHFYDSVPQESLTKDWNARSKKGNYKHTWIAAAFSCWQESARQTKENYRG